MGQCCPSHPRETELHHAFSTGRKLLLESAGCRGETAIFREGRALLQQKGNLRCQQGQMVQIDLTLSDSDDEKPPRAGNGSATASAGGRGQRERQQLMTEYLSPPKCNSTGSSKEGGRRVKKEPAAAPASFGAGSSSSGGSSSKAFVIDLSGENDDDDDVGGSQQRPPQEVACEAETNKGGGVIVDLSSSVSSSRGNPPATRDSVLEDDDDDDDDLIILDSEGEEDEPASPQQRLVVKPGAVPPPPRAAEPSKQRKRSPSPAIAADEEVGKRARFSQTTPDHVSGNDAAPISGPGSSLDGMMAKAELDAELALDDSEKLLSAKLEQDSEFASKYLDQLQEFYDRNFGDEDGGEGPSKPRKPRGCSVCGQKGHNRRRCPALSEQVDEDMDEVGDGGCAVAGGGLDDGVCGASSASSSGRGGHADWLWEDESMMAFERADVSSHHDMSYSQGKLWPVLRREAALGHVAPAYIVRMMVDALLDPGMLEKMQNNIDWKDLKGARTEHLQHLFASICQLIPAAGTNRYLPLEAPKGPRSYGVADPCSELCADVMAALKLLGTTSAADNKGSKGGKGGKGKGENSPEDESVSPAEKIKAEKSRRKQAKQARKDMYFRLQNVKCEHIPGLAQSSLCQSLRPIMTC